MYAAEHRRVAFEGDVRKFQMNTGRMFAAEHLLVPFVIIKLEFHDDNFKVFKQIVCFYFESFVACRRFALYPRLQSNTQTISS